jgi:hypothetical protein
MSCLTNCQTTYIMNCRQRLSVKKELVIFGKDFFSLMWGTISGFPRGDEENHEHLSQDIWTHIWTQDPQHRKHKGNHTTVTIIRWNKTFQIINFIIWINLSHETVSYITPQVSK